MGNDPRQTRRGVLLSMADQIFELAGGVEKVSAERVVDFQPLPPPPLPTAPGSLILARVAGGERPDLLELREVGSIGAGDTGRPASDLVWECGSNGWVRPEDITPGWVQIDPATLQPVAVTA